MNAWEQGYVRVNVSFADAVLEELEAQPDAAVFFHDYHLYLAPRIVREQAPDATLMHFVHIPWAQPDYWRVLPVGIRELVHDGLLANDVVGFHTKRWRRSFLRSLRGHRRRGLRPQHVRRRVPGAVDPRRCGADLRRPLGVRRARGRRRGAGREDRLVETRPERLILRVDRTDPSKNVVRGFQAYGLFLQAHPEFAGRVQMLALLDPSRQDIPEYAEYLGAIQRAARELNDRFRSEGWEPLVLLIEDDFAASVAAYKQFDVLLVNAIFDGLNLVAKEAPLVNERGGVLVLSENAGAHEELGEWALTVNPFDVEGQAEALHEALTMPAAERERRLAAIRAHVRAHDLAAWLDTQLAHAGRGRR